MNNTLTDVGGLKVGHYTDLEAATGCTVVLCPSGTVAGVDVRGAAPGTRETDLLDPVNTVQAINALVLTGGSAYGLDAAGGVMRWLEEQGMGFDVGVAVVPIVPAAVLFDLRIGRADVRPGPEAGYRACAEASREPVPEGTIGAGTGATVGKLWGMERATKCGLGSASTRLACGVTIAAMVAVNVVGDVISPDTGQIIAGLRSADGAGFTSTLEQMQGNLDGSMFQPGCNTTIGVVATDAVLTKSTATKLAQMAHDGLARTIQPVHTSMDGDTLFALGTGQSGQTIEVSVLGAVAAQVLGQAVLRAAQTATGLAGIPAADDIDNT